MIKPWRSEDPNIGAAKWLGRAKLTAKKIYFVPPYQKGLPGGQLTVANVTCKFRRNGTGTSLKLRHNYMYEVYFPQLSQFPRVINRGFLRDREQTHAGCYQRVGSDFRHVTRLQYVLTEALLDSSMVTLAPKSPSR